MPSGTAPAAAVPGGKAPHGGPPREVEVVIQFLNVSIRKPTLFENNGALTPMYPNDARLRNLTYAAPVYLDMEVTTTMTDPGKGTPAYASGDPTGKANLVTFPAPVIPSANFATSLRSIP
jgi:DNA-directed RNA polymerase beta subunit